MNGLALVIFGFVGLAVYIIYQAVMLDKYRKWNDELMREVEYLQPPF